MLHKIMQEKYNFELEFEKSKKEANNIIQKLFSGYYVDDRLKKLRDEILSLL